MSDAMISNRKLALASIVIASAWLLSGCTQAPVVPSPSPTSVTLTTFTPQPSPTNAPSQTAIATSTAEPPAPLPSITAQPWSTPAITPSVVVISPDDVDEVRQLAQFGMGTISDVALSADGTLLVVGSTTGVHFYDPVTLKLLRVIPAQRPVDRVVLSHDGRRLMSMELWSKGLPIWDTVTGELLKRLDTWTGSQHLATFSPDGSLVALAEEYENKPIQLWDITSGKITETLAGHDDGVRKLAFSPDGRLLASASWFDNVQIWDTRGRRRLRILPHERGSGALAFTPDGRNLVTADRPWQDEADGVLRLWDMETGKYLRSIVSDTVELDALQFSPDGSLLAGVGRHNILHLWDVDTGNLLYRLPDQDFIAGFSPDGQRLLTIATDRTLQWHDAQHGQLLKAAQTDYQQDVYDVAFSPDGQLLASKDGNNEVWLRSTQTGKVLKEFETQAWGSRFEPNSHLLLMWGDVNSRDTFIDAYDIVTDKKMRKLEIPDERVGVLAISPDGKYLALTADAPNAIQLRDASSGAVWQVFTATVSYMAGAAFSPDGRFLAAGSTEPYADMQQTDNSIWLWDLASGKFLRGFGAEGGVPATMDIAFSPNGKLLATASRDQKVQIWDPTSGRLLHTLEGGGSTVVFSPDGRLLASGDLFVDGENTVHLWDTRTGQQLQVLKGHTMGAVNVAFSPDGRLLATGATDGTIRLWGVPAP